MQVACWSSACCCSIIEDSSSGSGESCPAITLNLLLLFRDSKHPKPPPGTKWKEVRHDNKVTWLVSWTENIQGSIKYIMLNPSSRIKVPVLPASPSIVSLPSSEFYCSTCKCSARAGGEGLAEVRDGPAVEEVRGPHPYAVPGRLEVKGDEDQTESGGALLHR